MGSPKPALVLHVGAPKCASSALQTSLSNQPDLTTQSGQLYRYSCLTHLAGRWKFHLGATVKKKAHQSPYGYVSWPNLGIYPELQAPLFSQMHQLMSQGIQHNFTPIISSEGWINHPETFAKYLARWGHPKVTLVLYLRPIVDWVNAAFWQWGVWNTPHIDRWLARSNMSYSFANDLIKWAEIPNLTLNVRGLHMDVVESFAQDFKLPIRNIHKSNRASPAPLVGFLLRNRQFRTHGHHAAIEFVVQRWCPPLKGRKLWALAPRHIQALRPVRDHALKTFQAILSEPDYSRLVSDSGWHRESQYHSDLKLGPSDLCDQTQFQALYFSLCAGLQKIYAALEAPLPDHPVAPDPQASIEQWDQIFCEILELLIAGDEAFRHRSSNAISNTFSLFKPVKQFE